LSRVEPAAGRGVRYRLCILFAFTLWTSRALAAVGLPRMLLPSLSAVLLGMILIAAGRTRGQRHRGGPRHVLQRFDVPTRWL